MSKHVIPARRHRPLLLWPAWPLLAIHWQGLLPGSLYPGFHIEMFIGEKFACTSYPCLYFIEYQKSAGFVTSLPYGLKVPLDQGQRTPPSPCIGSIKTAHVDELILLQQCTNIIKRHIVKTFEHRFESFFYLFLSGCREGCHGPTMKRMLH